MICGQMYVNIAPTLHLIPKASNSQSRASAAALSTVMDDHTFQWKHPISGTYPAETPQPIKMKFCTIDNGNKVTRCAKNGWNWFAGDGPEDR
jgi:hypothetical protein